MLPLNAAQPQTIAVIGANAHWAAIMGGGSSEVAPHYVVTPLQGIRARVGAQSVVEYAIGCPIFRRLPNLETAWLRVPNSDRPGALLEYFAHPDLGGVPVYHEYLSTLEASWFGDQVEELPHPTFSTRLSCDLILPRSGRYQLGLACIGQARLWLNDELLIDLWEKALMDGSDTRRTVSRGSSRVDLQACKLGTGRRFTTS